VVKKKGFFGFWEGRRREMRVCPKCGFVDPPEWKHSKYSYWIDNCRLEDLKTMNPSLAKTLEDQGHAKDKDYVYRLTKNKTRAERKAIVDYGEQWTIPMEKAYAKHNFRDFRPCWTKINPNQTELLGEGSLGSKETKK